MTKGQNARARRIAELNDRLRKEPANRALGQVLLSAGIATRDDAFKTKVLAAIAGMTPKDFKLGNDPYRERDFNSFSVGERLCLFKIEYFAKGNLRKPSDDPADPAETERVMTVMFADEY